MQPKTPQRRSNFRRANRTMPRRRIDIALEALDYKNPDILKKFVTESGKILPRRLTGMPAHFHQDHPRDQARPCRPPHALIFFGLHPTFFRNALPPGARFFLRCSGALRAS